MGPLELVGALLALIAYVWLLVQAFRWSRDQVRFAIASQRYEGWGHREDPRSCRPELTWEQWRAVGKPLRYTSAD